ncbi:MAG: ComF family protein [Gemmatimonadales bacterium]|nr:ComF family protein [Gemmatimonadales bacterium]
MACRLCADWPPGLAGVRSAVWLGDTARQAVHLFKYQGWRRLAESFAVTLRRIVSIPPGSVLVPIPLGAARLKVRGYNQSAELAASLGQLFRLSVAPDVLRRRRETGTQTVLTPEARRANLAGAFVAAGQVPRTAVLVDDVFTTGATLFEAAGALLQGGASRVSAVTFARAPLPLADALAAAEA